MHGDNLAQSDALPLLEGLAPSHFQLPHVHGPGTEPVCMQAPLLAYNYFVEVLFVLNKCRAGLHGGGSAALISDTDMADATEGSLAQLQGSAPSARAKREAIYRQAETHR